MFATAKPVLSSLPASPHSTNPLVSSQLRRRQQQPPLGQVQVTVPSMPWSDWDLGITDEDLHGSFGRNRSRASRVHSSLSETNLSSAEDSFYLTVNSNGPMQGRQLSSLNPDIAEAVREAVAAAGEGHVDGGDGTEGVSRLSSSDSTTSNRGSSGEASTSGSRLLFDVGPEKEPVVYSSDYDVTFMGLEKLHPFDSTKWKRVLEYLIKDGRITQEQVTKPKCASDEDLLLVHTKEYLMSLKSSMQVAEITELPFVALIPNPLVQSHLLKPFRFQVGGSVLSARLALERGWAFNIGGGFHHCCAYKGGGFCAFADISILIKSARMHLGVDRVMIIDLDAHQGNGHERDFLGSPDAHRTYIFDMYNKDIYPLDHKAKAAINLKLEIRSGTDTKEYLALLEEHLKIAFDSFNPDLVVYNAGTDVLEGDPLGRLRVSASGVIERDEMVFSASRRAGVPIVMLTSGGYQKNNAQIIANSVGNLADKGLISLTAKVGIEVAAPASL